MSLPVRLALGLVSIYGADESDNNIHVGNAYRFGIVNDVWDEGSVVASIGQSVLFKIDDSVPLSYLNQNYWLVDENKIILVENVVV